MSVIFEITCCGWPFALAFLVGSMFSFGSLWVPVHLPPRVPENTCHILIPMSWLVDVALESGGWPLLEPQPPLYEEQVRGRWGSAGVAARNSWASGSD